MQIPSVKCDIDTADPTDHNRQTCVYHTDPTQANMFERSGSYRSHQGKHDIDPADHTGKQKII